MNGQLVADDGLGIDYRINDSFRFVSRSFLHVVL